MSLGPWTVRACSCGVLGSGWTPRLDGSASACARLDGNGEADAHRSSLESVTRSTQTRGSAPPERRRSEPLEPTRALRGSGRKGRRAGLCRSIDSPMPSEVVFSNPVNRATSVDTRPLSYDFENGEGESGDELPRTSTFDNRDATQPSDPSPEPPLMQAAWNNFLGHSPSWYKLTMVSFLLVNILIRFTLGKKLCAWAVLLEFIFSLACGLYCYPLQSGGLIVVEAFVLGLTKSKTMVHEVEMNLNVLLLVVFMVAAIHFLKNLLLWVFTKLLLGVESKIMMSALLMLTTAVLSAFLDALSVAAVLVSVCTGILGVYFHVVADADLPTDDSHHEVGVLASSPQHSCVFLSVFLCRGRSLRVVCLRC
eukprot:COSAG02_NODE_2431_length_8875_cov_9.810164_1_plen_366_part_00